MLFDLVLCCTGVVGILGDSTDVILFVLPVVAATVGR